MDIVIALIIAICGIFIGWGWHISRRWLQLLFRSLSIDAFMSLPVIYYAGWLNENTGLIGYFVIPFIIVPIVFFWEMIPFPILQVFKANGIMTIRVEKKVKPSDLNLRRNMKNEPESFVFPYIQSVSVSPIKNGTNYLHVRFYCPSSLPYDLKLSKCSVHFVINGNSVKNQPIFEGSTNPQRPKEGKKEYLIIFRENPNEKSLYIFLNRKMRAAVSAYADQRQPVEVWLEIIGYDDRDKRYILSTKPAPWKTILLQ